MSKNILEPTKEKTNGTKLRRLLLDGGTQVLRNLFDSIHPPSTLSGVLKGHEADIKSKKIVRFGNQIKLLLPSDGQPDSKTFDITLLSLLLRSICGLTAPTTGWNDEPDDSIKSQEANIVRIKLFRNKIQHHPGSGISDSDFKEWWKEISAPLIDLGLEEDIINRLQTDPIDDESEIQKMFQIWCDQEAERIDNLEEQFIEQGIKIKELQDRKCEPTDSLESCIPDEPPSFIGRAEALEQIIHAVEEKPFVLVHGMAGIGKTTLIKKASWDLVKKHGKTIFYVDLCRCEASEEEISKAITSEIYRCKVVKKTKEALTNWARNLKVNVILIVDNAQDVLGPDNVKKVDTGMPFKDILLEIRKFSGQKVSYLIASREGFELDLANTEIKLNPLPEKESLDFIKHYSMSRSFDQSNLTDNQGKTIADLCLHNPLALRIVSSLVKTEDYRAEELIQALQSQKLELLEGVEKAVSLSFDKIDKNLFECFALLTVFAGSFTADAAMAVTGQSKKDVVRDLQILLKKSLLQNEKGKYSIHPFIHEYVVGKKQTKEQLQEGKLNFLKYYQSLFLKNSNLYWTHDGCKTSLDNFFEDRVNFEKALKMSFETPNLWITIDTGLEKLKDLVMYLESCISWGQIHRLLNCFIDLANENKLLNRELEFICWKGHIARRKGDNNIYEELIKETDEIYNTIVKKSEAELDDSALVVYKTAKGRYLGYKGDREGGVQIFKEVIEICKEKIKSNPSMNEDYARAIVELGQNLKYKKKYKQALEKYLQAEEIYNRHLGEHIHTALGFKDIADGYMIQDTQGDFDSALEYYMKALDMLTKLNSGSGTHMILLLKNTGICYRNLNMYQESERCLSKAKTIADKNLKEDHKYKCWVKAELAHLYDDMKDKTTAKTLAKEAIKMANKLNLNSGDWLKDKEKLQTILDYPNENST
jgi:tetratricopeptide (TPR) repeat protein